MIIDALISMRSTNGLIYFDEVDKICAGKKSNS